MYFWALSETGRVGWLISLIYVVCVALRLARFNVSSNEESSWKDNFFEGIPSPAGGVIVLMPLILSISEFQFLNLNYQIVVPIMFIAVSILLISKIPTYSFKRIAVPRSTSIFLLFGIILYFGLILVYTFNAIIISGVIYLLMIPVSTMHYLMIKKNVKTVTDETDHHEDVL
jgi:CDP-diacylglycerol--serine O-phosphatidyltransferase